MSVFLAPLFAPFLAVVLVAVVIFVDRLARRKFKDSTNAAIQWTRSRAKAVLDALTGEILVAGANGGGVIVVRATIIAVELFVFSLGVLNWCDPNTGWRFSWTVAGEQVRDHLPWFGVMWGAAYVGLYARFASQWSYLAGLYNEILITEASGEGVGLKKLKLAFVVDAFALHMIKKEIFLHPARRWLVEREVARWYVEHNGASDYRETLLMLSDASEESEAPKDVQKALSWLRPIPQEM